MKILIWNWTSRRKKQENICLATTEISVYRNTLSFTLSTGERDYFFILLSSQGDIEVWLPGWDLPGGCRAVALGDGPWSGPEDAGNQYKLWSRPHQEPQPKRPPELSAKTRHGDNERWEHAAQWMGARRKILPQQRKPVEAAGAAVGRRRSGCLSTNNQWIYLSDEHSAWWPWARVQTGRPLRPQGGSQNLFRAFKFQPQPSVPLQPSAAAARRLSAGGAVAPGSVFSGRCDAAPPHRAVRQRRVRPGSQDVGRVGAARSLLPSRGGGEDLESPQGLPETAATAGTLGPSSQSGRAAAGRSQVCLSTVVFYKCFNCGDK